MSTTQTKKLSEATVVQSIADADKIPIVNSSGQTVLVPLSGLLGAIKVGARNLVRSTIYSASVPGARRTNGKYLNKSFAGPQSTYVCRISLARTIQESACYACSFWIKTTGATITLPQIDINDNAVIKNLTVGPEWQYIEGIATKPMVISPPLGFMDFDVPIDHENEVIISDLTVVQGNVPLQEWIPAPEDWGGVKTSLSAVCAFAAQLSAWKGGSHEPNEGLDEHGAQGYHDGRDGASWTHQGFRHNLHPWSLQNSSKRLHELSSRQLQLRGSARLIRRNVRSTSLYSAPGVSIHTTSTIYKSGIPKRMDAVDKLRWDSHLAARKEVAV